MFTDTVTFYQYQKTDGVESWKRIVIKGCQWSSEVIKQISSDGKLTAEKAVNITIPTQTAIMPEKYIDYRLYATQKPTDGFFTINPTSNMDVAVLGECEAVISKDYTLSQLIREHIAATVSAVTDNTGRARLKNIKVVAR